jgi:hypothetical protein
MFLPHSSNRNTVSEYMFLPHSSTMMATGCLYDAVFALGSKYLDLRRSLPELMGGFVDINKVCNPEFFNIIKVFIFRILKDFIVI